MSHFDQGQKLFYLLTGEACFGTGEKIATKLLTGETTEAYLNRALGQGVNDNSKYDTKFTNQGK